MDNASTSSDNQPRDQVEGVLQELQDELSRLGYWQGQLSEPERTNSSEPFCADSLDFTEWLQWVFIPRMRTVIRNGITLPFRCEITPRLEVWAIESPGNRAGDLVSIMKKADSLINQHYVA